MDDTMISIGISVDIAKDIKTDNNATEDRIMIEDINITTEMNTLQMAVQQQENAEDEAPTHVI